MAWTEADLNALDACIAKGEKSVTFADRTVTYRDVSEMLQARAVISAALAAASSDTPRPRQWLGTSSRGL
jgi:hypothetical protein